MLIGWLRLMLGRIHFLGSELGIFGGFRWVCSLVFPDLALGARGWPFFWQTCFGEPNFGIE